MNLAPEQTKVEQGGTYAAGGKAEIHDRAGLMFGGFGMAVAFLAIGIAWQSDKRHDDIARQQDARINQLETQVLLAREDLRAIAPQNTQLRSFKERPKR